MKYTNVKVYVLDLTVFLIDTCVCLFRCFIFLYLILLNPAEFIKVKWIQTLFLRLLVHLPVSCRQMSSRTPPWTFLSFMFGSSAAYVCVSGRSLTLLHFLNLCVKWMRVSSWSIIFISPNKKSYYFNSQNWLRPRLTEKSVCNEI